MCEKVGLNLSVVIEPKNCGIVILCCEMHTVKLITSEKVNKCWCKWEVSLQSNYCDQAVDWREMSLFTEDLCLCILQMSVCIFCSPPGGSNS